MRKSILLSSVTLFLGLVPGVALACACGCGVFDVGTGTMLPTGTGGQAWLEYDFMNQDMNWHDSSVAPESANSDKRIRSDFYTAGGEYMFNRSWGAMIEVPYTDRYFRTTDDSGNLQSFQHGAVGDIRVQGIYSGFSSDMSTGITYGLKLPTGDYSYAGFDRDTEIGSGSTDLLIGAYHMGKLPVNNSWNWFVDGRLDQPMLTTAGYRPGDEVDAATGVYYDMGHEGVFTNVAPLLQVIGSERLRDGGVNADPSDSGYTRMLLSPGIEADLGKMQLYADVELPVYQHVNGNQLVAPELFKVIMSYKF